MSIAASIKYIVKVERYGHYIEGLKRGFRNRRAADAYFKELTLKPELRLCKIHLYDNNIEQRLRTAWVW